MKRRKHFLSLGLLILFSLLFFGKVHAHTVVVSAYHLEFKKDRWMLSVKQETGSLRDALYALHPDLKGINLNSKRFLDATKDYIATTLKLENEGGFYKISPLFMRFDGRRFTGEFEVLDLKRHPEGIGIQTAGFEHHEHASRFLTIRKDGKDYRYQFFETNKAAYFDFSVSGFHSQGKKTTSSATPFFVVTGVLLLIVVFSQVFKTQKLLVEL
ncbi:MAG: hypothetical protein AAFQ20_12730 [Bacteroidota bacterium]